jgi:hypothetical protein
MEGTSQPRLAVRREGEQIRLYYLRGQDHNNQDHWRPATIIKNERSIDRYYHPFVEFESDAKKLGEFVRAVFPNQREIEREARRKGMAITFTVWRP